MFLPTIILAIPGIGSVYERGRLAELGEPIARPGTPATAKEISDASNAIEHPISPVDAIFSGTRLVVGDVVDNAKGDAFKTLLIVGGVVLVGVAIFKAAKK